MKHIGLRLILWAALLALTLPAGILAASQDLVNRESGITQRDYEHWIYLPPIGKKASPLTPIIPPTTNPLPPEATPEPLSVSSDEAAHTFNLELGLEHGASRAPAQQQIAQPARARRLWTTESEYQDDIMSPVTQSRTPPTFPATDYRVIPILFVPSDLTPNPNALPYINKNMQIVQRWYGEQALDRTFDFAPAVVVTGTHPLPYYYGPCYPIRPGCSDAGYHVWNNVISDLNLLGYPWQANRIRGVFLQLDGLGSGPALGGGNAFMVNVDTDNWIVIEDCWFKDCRSSVNRGGLAHELGHAFGLPHPDGDPQGGDSVMSAGLFGFPLIGIINTQLYPERDQLRASPFFNQSLSLLNGGFEDSLSQWTVSSGAPFSTSSQRHSGLKALELPGIGSQQRLDQAVIANSGQTYDFTGWLYKASSAGRVEVRVSALSDSGIILADFLIASQSSATAEWTRIGSSLTMPSGTVKARIEFDAQGLNASTYLDDFDWHDPQTVLPRPVPVYYLDGDAVPTLRPVVRWSDIPASTSYQIQVSTDRAFGNPLVDSLTASPFFTMPAGLTYNQRYFWRVRAINGAGASDWSLTWSFIPRSSDGYYNEEFEGGTYNSSAWSWIRPDKNEPNNWWLGSDRLGHIAIRSLGGLESSNDARNIFVRYPPTGDFAVTTQILYFPDSDYQQAGLLVYKDDDNYIRLMRASNTQFQLEWSAEVNGATVVSSFDQHASLRVLRIVRTGNTYAGYYSTDGIRWQRIGPSVTVTWPSPRIGLASYNPLNTASKEAYFDWVRFTTPCYLLKTAAAPTAGGTVISSEGDCDGGTGYSAGSTATITAVTNAMYSFVGWSGDASGTNNPLSLVMDTDKAITGIFEFNVKDTPTTSPSATPTATATRTPSPTNTSTRTPTATVTSTSRVYLPMITRAN